MRFREGDPDMTWQEARLQIGAAEGAIALLLFAKPAYEARRKREMEEAWQARKDAREARAAAFMAMPVTTEAEFRAAVEAIALSTDPWADASARPILHCIWYDDRVTLCDGENTARWYFGHWSTWKSVADFWDEIMDPVRECRDGASWDSECEEHELWSE
jgi:hypothetical protein